MEACDDVTPSMYMHSASSHCYNGQPAQRDNAAREDSACDMLGWWQTELVLCKLRTTLYPHPYFVSPELCILVIGQGPDTGRVL